MSNQTIDFNKLLGTIKEPLKSPFPKNTLTIAMIVKNEIAHIEKALTTILPIADEIIVNDTGSTDGTQDVLTRMGVKWFQSEWTGDFAAARNLSIEKATCAWVLWLDADDRIPDDQVENFRKLKTAPLDRVFGFQVINTQAGRPIGTRFMQIRMFPNHPKIRFERKIHEQVIFSAAKLGLHAIYTETTVWHTGYESEDKKKEKARRNLELSFNEPDLIGVDPAFTSCLGDSYYILEEWEKGIAAYQKVLEIPNLVALNKDVWALMPGHIGMGYFRQGKLSNAWKWLEKARTVNPNALEPLYYMAECRRMEGFVEDATKIYQQILAMPLIHSSTGVQWDGIRMYSYYHASSMLYAQKKYEEALEVLKTMVVQYPQVVEAWITLARTYIALFQNNYALDAYEKAIALSGGNMQDVLDEAYSEACRYGNQKLQDTCLKYKPELNSTSKVSIAVVQTKKLKNGLSLCMIVKNEEENLAQCLDSIKDVCDEIVIVDTGSTDKTIEIARDFGAVIHTFPWCNDFSAARNASLVPASYTWILWLDADDRIPQISCNKIKQVIKNPPEKAYGFVVTSSSDGGKTGSSFKQIRLFPNREEHRFTSPIHEQILPSLEKSGVPVVYTDIEVVHTGYAKPEVAQKKQIRNRDILENLVQKAANGEGHVTPVTLYTLGHAHFDLGDFDRAIDCFIDAAELAEKTNTDPHILQISPVKVAASLANLGSFEQANNTLQIALNQTSIHPEALLVKAQVEDALQHSEIAKEYYEKLLALEPLVHFIPANYTMFHIKALEFLGKYWNAKGNNHLAVTLLQKGLAISRGEGLDKSWLANMYRQYT